ncbi:MAG TPA: helix-turn-helix domain-containing protein [Caulobacteraceae bacterium]|jgi:hypothetical protein|nr:helix-turn-helix domain-containing protein [Caulobacteraceae bacterium]
MLSEWHREDIKAALRKRYGSVQAFERAKGLPQDSVSDVLRGRTAGKTAAAIVEELAKTERASGEGAKESDLSDHHTLSPQARHGVAGQNMRRN